MTTLLVLLSTVLVIASIPVTGLPGVLLAVSGIACSLVVRYRIRRGVAIYRIDRSDDQDGDRR